MNTDRQRNYRVQNARDQDFHPVRAYMDPGKAEADKDMIELEIGPNARYHVKPIPLTK